jgi:prolyl-tRNA synthetase
VIVRRDTGEKVAVPGTGLKEKVSSLLDEIQASLYERSLRFREENTFQVDGYREFKELCSERGGFLKAHWCGEAECEEHIKEETLATVRCIPFGAEAEDGACLRCGKASRGRVYFAKAY